MKKKQSASSVIFVLIIIGMIVGCALLVVREEKKEQASQNTDYGSGVLDELSEEQLEREMSLSHEWENMEDVLEGDAVPDNYTDNMIGDTDEMKELFSVESVSEAKSRLIIAAEEYNELIPYGYQGRSWSYGYFKQEDGYENILYDSCANGLGLDGLGYVIWLYRNSFGHTPKELLGEFSVKNMQHAVNTGELQVGDLCVTTERDQDVQYGVVCGYSPEGYVIVTMCDNTPNLRFKYGCNHLVYIKSNHNEYLGNYAPVDFKLFFRMDEMLTVLSDVS